MKSHISGTREAISLKFGMWSATVGGNVHSKNRLVSSRMHRATEVRKLRFLSSCQYTHGCYAPASWAARHTTVCLDNYTVASVCCLLFISSCDKETFLKPLLLFDSDQSVEDSRDGCSFSNVLECKLIMEICNLLLRRNLPHANIGIITPYRAQTKLIQSSLEWRYWYIHMCMVRLLYMFLYVQFHLCQCFITVAVYIAL